MNYRRPNPSKLKLSVLAPDMNVLTISDAMVKSNETKPFPRDEENVNNMRNDCTIERKDLNPFHPILSEQCCKLFFKRYH